MSPDPSDRHSAAAIAAHARRLAALRSPSGPDEDADILADLASGTTSPAEVDDATLERLGATYGIESLARAIMAAPEGLHVERQAAAATIVRIGPSSVSAPGPAPAPVPVPVPVIDLSARRLSSWGQRSTWMAAAASLVLLVGAGAFLTNRGLPDATRDAASTGAQTQTGGATPRLQPDARGADGPVGPVGPRIAAAPRVVVLLRGNDAEVVTQAESALLRSFVGQGAFRAIDAARVTQVRDDDAIEAAMGGDFSPLDARARTAGADLVVVGQLDSYAMATGDSNYSGSADMSVSVHTVADRARVEPRTFRSGGETRPILAASEREARLLAGQDAAAQASAIVPLRRPAR